MLDTAVVLVVIVSAAVTLACRALRSARSADGCARGTCTASESCPLAKVLTTSRGGARRAAWVLVAAAATAGAEDPTIDLSRTDGGGRPVGPAAPADTLVVASGTFDGPDTPWRGTTLGGDLGGLRPWLGARGLALEVSSVDEGLGTRWVGSEDSRYAGLLDVALNADLEAALGWRDAEATVLIQNTRGGCLSEEVVGAALGLSSLGAPSMTQLAEWWVDAPLGADGLRLKVGRQDANADFAAAEAAGDLVHAAFGMPPTAPLPAFPAPALGAAVGWSGPAGLTVRTGVWDGASEPGTDCFRTALDGVLVAAAEVQWTTGPDDDPDARFRFGGWRLDPPDAAGEKAAGGSAAAAAFGAYLVAEGRVWRSGGRSLQAFAQLGTAPGDALEVTGYVGAGARVVGLLPDRPDDALSVGVARAELAGGGVETAFEVGWRIAVQPWLDLQPDVIVVDRPAGGDGRAVVLGVRMITRL